MTLGLLAALGAALCSGVAAVLQARAVGRPGSSERLGAALLVRLLRSGTYLTGLALVAAGFLLSVVALHDLPVFVVAVARASSLGVTALLAWPLLGVRVGRREAAALVALAAGLVVVVASGEAGAVADVPSAVRWGLPVALIALVGLALVVERRPGPRAGVALAAVAGLDFGLVGVAARAVTGTTPGELVVDPALWALGGAGLHGLVVYAAALQRTTVTRATAALVGIETLSGAAAGILLLGDSPRPGWALAGAAGFALALAAALSLAGSQPVVSAQTGESPTGQDKAPEASGRDERLLRRHTS